MQFKDLKPGAHFWVKEKPGERFLKIHPFESPTFTHNTCGWDGFGEEFSSDQEVVELKIGRFENTQEIEAVLREIKRLQEVAEALLALNGKTDGN